MHTVEFLNNSNISVKTQPNSKIRIMKKKKTEVELDTLPLTGNTVLVCVYFTFYFTNRKVRLRLTPNSLRLSNSATMRGQMDKNSGIVHREKCETHRVGLVLS